jgi:hypothetical protein
MIQYRYTIIPGAPGVIQYRYAIILYRYAIIAGSPAIIPGLFADIAGGPRIIAGAPGMIPGSPGMLAARRFMRACPERTFARTIWIAAHIREQTRRGAGTFRAPPFIAPTEKREGGFGFAMSTRRESKPTRRKAMAPVAPGVLR